MEFEKEISDRHRRMLALVREALPFKREMKPSGKLSSEYIAEVEL